MGDHDIFDSEVAGCLDDGKDLIRCDMGSSKDCIVIADKFQYRAQFRNDLSVFYDFHALAQILAHFLHVIFADCVGGARQLLLKTKCGIDGFRIDPPTTRFNVMLPYMVKLFVFPCTISL